MSFRLTCLTLLHIHQDDLISTLNPYNCKFHIISCELKDSNALGAMVASFDKVIDADEYGQHVADPQDSSESLDPGDEQVVISNLLIVTK